MREIGFLSAEVVEAAKFSITRVEGLHSLIQTINVIKLGILYYHTALPDFSYRLVERS